MKQTSIDWLIRNVNENIAPKYIPKEVAEQAKEMHKKEIIKAAARGYLVGEDAISLEDAKLYGEEYYNITFEGDNK